MTETMEGISAAATQGSTPEAPRRNRKPRMQRKSPENKTESPQLSVETPERTTEKPSKARPPRAQRVPRTPREDRSPREKRPNTIIDGTMEIRLASAQGGYNLVNKIKFALCGLDSHGEAISVTSVKLSALGSAVPRVISLASKLEDVCDREAIEVGMLETVPKLSITLVRKESWDCEDWLAKKTHP